MMPKHSGEPDLALAGLVLLIIFAFMMWQDRPIQSPRPVDLIDAKQHAPHAGKNTYESWLWQDPFDFDPVVDPLHEKLHGILKLDNKEMQGRNSRSNDHCFCHKGLLTKEILDVKSKNATLRIIAPFVQITPNTVEIKEFRTRYRYALVSGLIEAGYRPLNPQSLNFCASNRNNDKNKYDVRWEQWKLLPSEETKNPKNNNPEYIFVIWSDDSQFASEKINNSLQMKGIEFSTFSFDSKHTLGHYLIDDFGRNYLINKTEKTSNELVTLLKEELIARKITNPDEIAIISEYDTKSVREFAGKFCKQFGKNDCEKMSNFTYLKGLDAYRRSIGKLEQQEIANKALEKRDKLLSIIDQHNLPAGPSQLDYLYRLARQIKESHNDSDHKKHIKAVGVFGSDFYDKLIIFQVLRAEIPNIVLFTTELDAEMLHPQYWRWTRNLIVATPFDLRLKDEFQNQTPPFRDSLQTQIYFEILKTFGNAAGEAPPLVFEIGRNGPIYLASADDKKNSVHPDYGDNNRLKKQLLFWVFIVVASIFIVHQIKPHSGVIVIWLAITAVGLFVIAFYAVNLKNDEPFSFTSGVSMWPSILLRWLTFCLAVAFIFSAIRSLEANFDRLTRRYYSKLTDLITLYRDEKRQSSPKLPAVKAILTEKRQSFKAILAVIFLIFVSVLIYADGINISLEDILRCCSLQHMVNSIVDFLSLIKMEFDNFTVYYFFLVLVMLILIIVVTRMTKSIQVWIERDAIRVPQSNARAYEEEDNQNYESKAVILEEDLWKEYYARGRFRHRFLRASIKFSVFMIVAVLLYQLFPALSPPCRGEVCIALEEISRVLIFSIIMLLTFLVLDAQRLCLHWIEKLRTKHPLLLDASTLTGDYRDKISEVNYARYDRNAIYKLKDIITLVAKRTRVVDRLIYYPLIVIMLMLIARINYFDNIAFPLHVGFTVILSISLLLYAGAKLRIEAVQLKRTAINCAKDLPHPDRDAVIQEIQAIDYGAFEPLFEQPAIRSLLLTLGFVGLVVTEYLKLFG